MHGRSEARLPAAVACGTDVPQASQPLQVSLAAMLAHSVGAAIRFPAAHVLAEELRGAIRDASPLQRARARRRSPLGPRGGGGDHAALPQAKQRPDRILCTCFRRGLLRGLLLALLHAGHQHSQRALRFPFLGATGRPPPQHAGALERGLIARGHREFAQGPRAA
eukprot:CAMPEP_0118827790 /NCGR_PEP_ID=MMETSP1162-20130426/14756_1 /TAXON_ID=33656 /ORGANISM="Phaeocystis Sp, Strain CCMP2710" /LENGTH=164 /DNA_ID=CAMNT_0006758635 /DNA_START=201 /DNA_END=695 /DNA_ORIENTATION=+